MQGGRFRPFLSKMKEGIQFAQTQTLPSMSRNKRDTFWETCLSRANFVIPWASLSVLTHKQAVLPLSAFGTTGAQAAHPGVQHCGWVYGCVQMRIGHLETHPSYELKIWSSLACSLSFLPCSSLSDASGMIRGGLGMSSVWQFSSIRTLGLNGNHPHFYNEHPSDPQYCPSGCSSPLNVHRTKFERANWVWLKCDSRCSGPGFSLGSSVDKRLKEFGSSQQVGGKAKEKGSFYSTCECIFLWQDGWRWISTNLVLLVFGGTYVYTHKPHTAISFIDSRPNSTWFPTLPPLNLGKL